MLVIIGSICAIIIVLGPIYNCWQRRLPKMKNMVSTGWVEKVARLLALGMEGIGKLRGRLLSPVHFWDIAGYTAGAAVESIQMY